MASYDSDSDIDEDFTETNVLLGYASKDAGDEDTISRLGGVPDWLDADKAPSAALARCGNCKSIMSLLLQLNAEIPDRFPGHARRLYVFACRKQKCQRKQGSIRALRGTRVSKEAVEAAAAAAAAKEAKEAEDKQKREEAERAKKEGPGLGDALFGGKAGGGGGANPFSSGGAANPFSSSSSANPFSSSSSKPTPTPTPTPTAPAAAASAGAPKDQDPPKTSDEAPASQEQPDQAAADLPKSFAETLNLNNPQKTNGSPPPPEPWPSSSSPSPSDPLPKPYPVSYLSEADYETLDPEPAAPPPQATKMEIDDTPEASGSGGAAAEKEVFESTMDAVFQKFADRLAQNPDQCIRYEFAGQPLLYSKADGVGRVLGAAADAGKSGMPRCGNCGAGRVFEVQMTPQAIAELEDGEELGLEGMEWGTVVVGVCEKDCLARGVEGGEAGYVEEWCGVQWEELAKK